MATTSQHAAIVGAGIALRISWPEEGKTYSAGQTTDHDSTIVSLDGNLEDALPAPIVDISNVNDPNLWGNAKSSNS